MPDDARAFLDQHFPGLDWPVALWPLLRTRRLARGAVLVPQGGCGHPLHGVLSGQLEIRFLGADGAVSVIEHVGPGRLFGLTSLVTGSPSRFEAVAASAARVLAIDTKAYALMMDEVPGLARALMREFAQRHDTLLKLLDAARHQPAMARLQLALAQLRREQAEPRVASDGAVALRTTQAGLAELAGLSRQSVNALLAQLEAQGQLRRAYGCLWWRGG